MYRPNSIYRIWKCDNSSHQVAGIITLQPGQSQSPSMMLSLLVEVSKYRYIHSGAVSYLMSEKVNTSTYTMEQGEGELNLWTDNSINCSCNGLETKSLIVETTHCYFYSLRTLKPGLTSGLPYIVNCWPLTNVTFSR